MALLPPPPPQSASQTADIEEAWGELAQVLSPFTMVEGYITQEPTKVQAYYTMAAQPWVQNICETGFNGGHSAMLFLLSNPRAKVFSFDLGVYPYSKAAASFLANKFPGRFVLVPGDSRQSVPALHAEMPGLKCQMLSIDGGHGIDVVRADITNLQKLADPERNLVVVNNSPCEAGWCTGPSSAWQEAVESRAILPLSRSPLDGIHGFSAGVLVAPGSPLATAGASG